MRIKMNPEKAAALGWTVMLPAEARNHTINEWVVKEEEKYQELISERHRKIIADRKATRERNATLAVDISMAPLRISGRGASKKRLKGKHFFVGDIQHVAVYTYQLTQSTIIRRVIVGTRSQALEAERLYGLATNSFEISLLHCYDDPIVLRRFAEAICQQATHDRNRLTDADEYKAKVRKALSMFERTNTPRGIKSLLDALPDEYAFASLAQECWESLCRTDPNFFQSQGEHCS